MKKRIALVLLQLFMVTVVLSQQNFDNYDSLRQVLVTASHDSSKVNTLATLCQYYMFTRPDSSIFYGYKGLALARQISDVDKEVRLLRDMSTAQNTLGNSAKGLQLTLQAMRLAEEYNIIHEKAILLLILGNRYGNRNEFPKKLSLLKEAEKLLDSLQDFGFAVVTRQYIANVYLEMNQLDSALYYGQTAYEKAASLKLAWVTYRVLLTQGRIEQARGNYQSAIEHFRNALPMTGTALGYFETNFAIAKFFRETNELDSGIYYALKSLEIAQTGNLYLNIVDAGMMLSGIYEKKDDINKAFEYSMIAIAAKDSLYKLNQTIAIENLKNFDEQERQYELDAAKTEFQNKLRMNIFLGSTFTLLVVAFLLYRNNKQKQKANALLKEQKEEVQSTLEKLESTQSQLIQSEKMASLGELTAGIAHEIQNPLNFVNNFSEVNTELLDEASQANAAGKSNEVSALLSTLKNNEEKINHHGKRADAIVKGMLQHSRTSSGQKELTDINAVCDEYLRLSYHGLRAKDKSFNAKFETDFDSTLPKLNLVPQDIGRVVLNLINNAFFAVNEKRTRLSDGHATDNESYEPIVTVSTKNLGDKIEIRVKDNGNGIPNSIKVKIFQPFFTTKPTGQGTGLGLSLAYDIVTKGHGGSLSVRTPLEEVESAEGVGTEFVIQLPAKNNGG